MAKGYVYIILQNNGLYYIGSTGDIERRMRDHNRGRVRTTSKNLPLKLLYKREYNELKDARDVEIRLKNYKSRKIGNKT